MTDAREDLKGSVREKIELRHSIKSSKWMRSRSHDLGVEVRMHSLTVDCETLLNEEKDAQLSQ